jgi:cephalosporin-C deacetylase-like acetyl esterase
MNLLGKLQSEYEQLWKHIVRPSRTAYSEDSLGPTSFHLEGQEVLRRDFQLTNSRGHSFSASLWTPTLFDKCNCVLYLHGNAGNRTEGSLSPHSAWSTSGS